MKLCRAEKDAINRTLAVKQRRLKNIGNDITRMRGLRGSEKEVETLLSIEKSLLQEINVLVQKLRGEAVNENV